MKRPKMMMARVGASVAVLVLGGTLGAARVGAQATPAPSPDVPDPAEATGTLVMDDELPSEIAPVDVDDPRQLGDRGDVGDSPDSDDSPDRDPGHPPDWR